MKKIVYLFILLFAVTSCVSKRNAEQLTDQKDSLSAVIAQKDSIINDVFAAMNGIAENLNAIKSRENIINTQIDNGEIKKQTPAQISEDVEAINKLLLQNKETISRLQKSVAQLKKANLKIEGLEQLVSQLQTQIETKDQEITVLKKNLDNMHVEVAELHEQVSGLNTQVTDLTAAKSSLEGEVKATNDILNTGYYIVGEEKELLKKEIVYKSGFIGRTLKINENRSLDSFTQVDIRDLDEVVIGQKKVTVVSSHPEGSYILEADSQGVYSSLIITDKDKFWEYSKVLVISFK